MTARASSRRAESQQHLDRVGTPSVDGRSANGREIRKALRLASGASPTDIFEFGYINRKGRADFTKPRHEQATGAKSDRDFAHAAP